MHACVYVLILYCLVAQALMHLNIVTHNFIGRMYLCGRRCYNHLIFNSQFSHNISLDSTHSFSRSHNNNHRWLLRMQLQMGSKQTINGPSSWPCSTFACICLYVYRQSVRCTPHRLHNNTYQISKHLAPGASTESLRNALHSFLRHTTRQFFSFQALGEEARREKAQRSFLWRWHSVPSGHPVESNRLANVNSDCESCPSP